MQSGCVIQEKVARLLSKERGKPVLKPNKPLALKNEVANRKPKKGGKNFYYYLLVLLFVYAVVWESPGPFKLIWWI